MGDVSIVTAERAVTAVNTNTNLITMANSVALGTSIIENLIGVDLSKEKDLDVCHHMATLFCIEFNKRMMAIQGVSGGQPV